MAGVGDGANHYDSQEESFDDGPPEVANGTQHTHNEQTFHCKQRAKPSGSGAMHCCRFQFDSTNANISRNASVALTDLIISVFVTLFLLAFREDGIFELLLCFGVLGIHDLFLTLKISFFILSTSVPEITLVVHLSALAGHAVNQLLVVLTIVATGVLLATRVGCRLAHEAFI